MKFIKVYLERCRLIYIYFFKLYTNTIHRANKKIQILSFKVYLYKYTYIYRYRHIFNYKISLIFTFNEPKIYFEMLNIFPFVYNIVTDLHY